jgi:hypothetical protein
MKKYLLVTMLSILFFNAKLLAQPDFQITELPFRNEMLRIDWTSNKAAKPLFDSAANEVARILENAYLQGRLARSLDRNIIVITYYINTLKPASVKMKKQILEDHKKSGAIGLYNGLIVEEEKLKYLAQKRLNFYARILTSDISNRINLKLNDPEASSVAFLKLKKVMQQKVELCENCEEKITLKFGFDSLYMKKPELKFTRVVNDKSDLIKIADSYPLNELSPQEIELYELITNYRSSLNLPEIPISQSLNIVARTHVRDLYLNGPFNAPCNLHSWSVNNEAKWSPCCYTDDHRFAACMWNKPRELTKYKGNGYEIAYWTSSGKATPKEALQGWKGSYLHHIAIKNADSWKDVHWKAIGIGIYGGYACVWFGEETDEFIYDPIFIDLSSK